MRHAWPRRRDLPRRAWERHSSPASAVFLTTQYLEEADRLADRVAIIDRGSIRAEGTPPELKAAVGSDVIHVEVPAEQPDNARSALEDLEGLRELRVDQHGLTLFVSDGATAVPTVLRRLDRSDVPVEATGIAQPTLDDVFLRVTGHRLDGPEDAGLAQSQPH